MKAIRRHQIADYISKDGKAYALMGVGFNSLDESPNPNVDSKIYISDKSSTSTITKYEPEFAFDADHIEDEEAVSILHKIGRDRLTGEDAELDYVRVDLYSTGTSGKYPARKFRVAAEVTDLDSGEGGEVVKLAGTLHQIGDFTEGTFDVTQKTFTAGS